MCFVWLNHFTNQWLLLNTQYPCIVRVGGKITINSVWLNHCCSVRMALLCMHPPSHPLCSMCFDDPVTQCGHSNWTNKISFTLGSEVRMWDITQWQYCTSYRMIYFLYEVNCCFLYLAFYFINTSYYVFSLHLVEKLPFKSIFRIWSHSAAKWIGSLLFLLYFLSILIVACQRQMEMSHPKERVLLRTQFENFKGKQRIYFIFYPFSLNWIHIYCIFCLKLLHFYFLYEVLLFMKHQYCHCPHTLHTLL